MIISLFKSDLFENSLYVTYWWTTCNIFSDNSDQRKLRSKEAELFLRQIHTNYFVYKRDSKYISDQLSKEQLEPLFRLSIIIWFVVDDA